MSELYRRISVRMWVDEDFRRLSGPPPNTRYLWIYLLSGPHTTPIPGLFAATQEGLAAALKWPLKPFRNALSELMPAPESHRKAFLEADWDAGVIWIAGALKHNEPANPNIVRSWRTPFDLIPECELKRRAACFFMNYAMSRGKGFPKAFASAFGNHSANGSPNGFRNHSANREQEQEQEQDHPIVPSRDGPNHFAGTHGLVRLEFERRFAAATGNPPAWGVRALGHAATVASWLDSLDGEPEQSLSAALDGFFRDEWAAERGFPIGALASSPGKFLRPPPKRTGGLTRPAPHDAHSGGEIEL